MDSIVPVLIGVVVGSLLTTANDLLRDWRTTRKDIEYLSVQIVCMLERFSQGCAEVAGDPGMPDSDGRMHINSKTPSFNPESIDVKWKALPSNLMYDILQFPIRVEDAEASIMAVLEHEAGPPDYSEMFDERHYQYTRLGIKAVELAARLRKKGKLPEREIGDWDFVEYLTTRSKEIETKKAQKDKAHKAFLAGMKKNQLESK